MSKKIRKKDLLKRLEAVEKWQRDYAEAQRKRLEAEIKKLEWQVDYPQIPLLPFGDLPKSSKPGGGIT